MAATSTMRRSQNRHRDSPPESRQPEDEGRHSSRRSTADTSSVMTPPPRTPRSTTTSVNPSGAKSAPTSPAGGLLSPTFNKARCYRLNLEKPFDISEQKSPLGANVTSNGSVYSRDYSGPINENDLPPCAGPLEYYPPPHLCSREELRRHHSWSGNGSGSGRQSSASELMANLQVSCSEDSTQENDKDGKGSKSKEVSIAISTARIFRGITVDRNGVVTSQNARATRSRKGGEPKNKQGEKSRQAAKIDKAKDLIDDIVEGKVPAGGSGGSGSDEENDPSKIVSLYVMGEYEELNDLVRDGSKRLRDGKTLSDEAILMHNRPRPAPSHIASPSNNTSSTAANAGNVVTPGSPHHTRHSSNSSMSESRKRLGSGYSPADASKSRNRYKQVPRSAPPKLKGHPRDRPSSRRSGGGSTAGGMGSPRLNNNDSWGNSRHTPTGHGHGGHGGHSGHHTPTHNLHDHTTHSTHNSAGSDHKSHYFQQQCNFFPSHHGDWTEALGFSVNSLWNCGANGGHMSPTNHPSSHGHSGHSGHSGHHSQPSSPRGSVHSGAGVSGYGHGGHGGGMGTPAGGGYNYHYGHRGGGGYEDRNPSYGFDGRSRNGGVRDTVVM